MSSSQKKRSLCSAFLFVFITGAIFVAFVAFVAMAIIAAGAIFAAMAAFAALVVFITGAVVAASAIRIFAFWILATHILLLY